MNKLQMLAVLFFVVGSGVVSASDKAARQDAYERKVIAKEVAAEKNRRKFKGCVPTQSLTIAAVASATTTKPTGESQNK